MCTSAATLSTPTIANVGGCAYRRSSVPEGGYLHSWLQPPTLRNVRAGTAVRPTREASQAACGKLTLAAKLAAVKRMLAAAPLVRKIANMSGYIPSRQRGVLTVPMLPLILRNVSVCDANVNTRVGGYTRCRGRYVTLAAATTSANSRLQARLSACTHSRQR